MTCDNCQQAESRQYWGGYTMDCTKCCARLVISARPSKAAQEAMLAHIARQHGAPAREEVLAQIKLQGAAK